MRISIEKRFLSLMLALVMMVSMVQLSAVEVLASSLKTTVLEGKVSISGVDDNALGTGTANDDGSYTFTMVAEAKTECMDTTYTAKSHTITIANTTQEDVSFSFSYTAASFGGFTVDGTDKSANPTGTWEGTLTAEASIVFVLTSVATNNTTMATLTLGDFVEASSDTFNVTVEPGVNGIVTVNGTSISTNTTVATSFAEGVAVTATAGTGYVFLGWRDANGKIVSYSSSTSIRPIADMTVSAVFAEDGIQGYWSAAGSIYSDLNAACENALNGDGLVILLNDAILPAGNYTIPTGVTVLIPFDAANTIYGPAPEVLQSPNGNQTPKGAYRTLTMADGAKLTVNGNLEVGAKHHASHGGSVDGGTPYDYYGHIVMTGSSAIEIKNGGCLYAWGYVTGSDTATVTAKSGAKVYEKMQVSDYRGGMITSAMVGSGIFPFNQYYIQNVEVKETFEYGSTLICHAGIYGNGVESSAVDFMGSESAMFTLGESTTVTKYYDAATDRLIMDAEGDISMNAISIMGYDTSKFILPFNHNITVNIKSGTATLNQDIMLQPGATINVGKNASLTLASGKKLYLMDASEWGNFCFGKQMQQISYVPSKGGAPNIRQASLTGAPVNMGDATINVNGTFNVNGQVYATSSGAQIVSKDKTGVINFIVAAPTSSTSFKQSIAAKTTDMYKTETVTLYPALLTNGNASTINTNGIAADTTYFYCAQCDVWYTGKHVFQITWNVNGTISTSDVHAGKTVSYPGTTPTKAADANGHFIFAGWADTENGTVLTELPVAAANAAYYAVFTSEAHADTATKDHKCDTCGYATSTCPVDADKNHVCDICGHTTSHTDTDFDHDCEYCGQVFSDCKDEDNNCICDYAGCKKQLAHKPNADDVDCTTDITCSVCGTVTTEGKDAHTPNADDGDCTTDITCSVCGTVTTEGKDDHSYTVEQSRTDATCMAQGSVTWKCANCNATTTETLKIDPANHTGVNHTENAKDATCTEAGYTGDTVCECGTTVDYGSTIPNTGHTNSEAVTENEVGATCTTDGSYDTVVYCTVCGEELSRVTTTVPSAGHGEAVTYTNNGDTHSATYDCCGAVYVTDEGHTYVDGTCACGAAEPVIDITVVSKGVGKYDTTTDSGYSVNGNVVTVKFSIACKVGYLVDGSYVAITAVPNDDGSYSFTAPEGVTEVLLVVKGDANADGKITMADANRTRAQYNNKLATPLTAEQMFAADVNGDGKITMADANRIRAAYNKKITQTWG